MGETDAERLARCLDEYDKCAKGYTDEWGRCKDDALKLPTLEEKMARLKVCTAARDKGTDLCGITLCHCVGKNPDCPDEDELKEQRERFKRNQKNDLKIAVPVIGGLGATFTIGGITFLTSQSPIKPPAAFSLAVTGIGIACIYATAYVLDKVLDPTDKNYKRKAHPRPPKPPHIEPEAGTGLNQEVADALNAVLKNQAEALGIDRALLASINRAQGAAADEELGYEKTRMKDSRKYAGDLAKLIRQSAGLRSKAANKLRNNDLVFSVSKAEAIEACNLIIRKEIPQEINDLFRSYGRNRQERELINTLLVSKLSDLNALAIKLPRALTKAALASAEKKVAFVLEKFSKSTSSHG